MTDIRLQEPFVCGRQVIVPVVRATGVNLPGGGFAGVSPVALLIGESGEWFFVALEEGFGAEEIAGLFETGAGTVAERSGGTPGEPVRDPPNAQGGRTE